MRSRLHLRVSPLTPSFHSDDEADDIAQDQISVVSAQEQAFEEHLGHGAGEDVIHQEYASGEDDMYLSDAEGNAVAAENYGDSPQDVDDTEAQDAYDDRHENAGDAATEWNKGELNFYEDGECCTSHWLQPLT